MSYDKIWREYRAPDGRKYYYNVKTKETTWNKPAPSSTPRTQGATRAVYTFDLFNDVHLVVFSDGVKRYSVGSTYVDEVEDKLSQRLLGLMDQSRVDRLCRSMQKGTNDELYEQIREDIEFLKSDLRAELEPPKRQKLDIEEVKTSALLAGYSSSSEDEEEEVDDVRDAMDDVKDNVDEVQEDVDEVQEETDITVQANEDKKEEATKVVEDTKGNAETKENEREIMFDLFEKYELDKFSTWKNESLKINNDPLFFSVMDDSIREEYFEQWCGQDADADVSDEEEEGEPTKYHYLSQLVANYDVKPDTIPQDITRDKKLMKQYRIKDYTSKQERTRFLTKVLAWYKHLTVEERKAMVREYLVRLELTAKPAAVEPQEDVESQLLSLESQFGLPKHEDDYEYYAIDLRSKRDLIIALLNAPPPGER